MDRPNPRLLRFPERRRHGRWVGDRLGHDLANSAGTVRSRDRRATIVDEAFQIEHGYRTPYTTGEPEYRHGTGGHVSTTRGPGVLRQVTGRDRERPWRTSASAAPVSAAWCASRSRHRPSSAGTATARCVVGITAPATSPGSPSRASS